VLASKKLFLKLKGNGGWGLKDTFSFTKSLEAKNSWILVDGNSLWHIIINKKCFPNILFWSGFDPQSNPKIMEL